MHKARRIVIPIVILLALIAVGTWYIIRSRDTQAGGPITASGTVEAVEILVAPELAGRVTEVLVAKGNQVKAGDPLFRLDDELLRSQHQRAVTALESSQTNLSTALTGLEMANASLRFAEANLEVVSANAEVELLAAQQALDNLFENEDVVLAVAMEAVATANRAVREAQYRLDNFTVPITQKDMTAMEAISATKKLLDQARLNFEPYKYRSSDDPTREELREALDEAQADYDSAVKRMEYETALDGAQATWDNTMQDLESLMNGPDPDDIAMLETRIKAAQTSPKQAEASVVQAEVGILQAQSRLEQAEASVAQALSELDLIEVQMGKLVVYAPSPGVVLSRKIEPGEVVAAGAPVMTIGQLDQLNITVYVPENLYGKINLGEKVNVTVDSFPNETFSAKVVYIADQAEYTPRNVQTAEGRRTTVFAIELAIANPEGKLKPGMPADVCFACP